MKKFELSNGNCIEIFSIDASDLSINTTATAYNAALIVCNKGQLRVKINLLEAKITASRSVVVLPTEMLTIEEFSENFQGDIIIIDKGLIEEALVRIELSVIGQFFRARLNSEKRKLSFKDDNIKSYFFNAKSYFQNTIKNLMIIASMPATKHKRDQVLCMLRGLFCFISSCIELVQKNESKNPESQNYNRMEAHLQNFIKLVQLHYKESREVAFYAEKMNLTPKYLNFIASSISKMTCKQIINGYVVNRLKNDFRYSEKTIQEIAYEYNFANQSFLGSFFKKWVGVSPRKFRSNKE